MSDPLLTKLSSEEIKTRIQEFLGKKEKQMSDLDHQTLLTNLNIYQQELEFQNDELLNISLRLQELKEDYQDLFHQAPVGYAVYDENLRLIEANETLLKFTGFGKENLKHISLPMLFDADSQDSYYFHIRNLLKTGEPQQTSLNLKTGNKPLPVLLESNLVIKGGIKKIRSAFMDISREREAQSRLESVNAAQKKFFQILSHDLKNSFINILGFTELLSKNFEKSEPEKNRFFIQTLHNSARQSFQLLKNLVEWSASQSHAVAFRPEKLPLLGVVSEAEYELKLQAEKKEIQIEIALEPGTEVFADRNMLLSILRNLMSNALKFSPRGQKISVYGRQLEKGTEIKVQDQGKGMPPDTLQTLFSLETKISRPGTENEKGTGLGLILCREFVDRHHGTLQAESAPDRGSVFTVFLPQPGAVL